jgi:hypothetical protein
VYAVRSSLERYFHKVLAFRYDVHGYVDENRRDAICDADVRAMEA